MPTRLLERSGTDPDRLPLSAISFDGIDRIPGREQAALYGRDLAPLPDESD